MGGGVLEIVDLIPVHSSLECVMISSEQRVCLRLGRQACREAGTEKRATRRKNRATGHNAPQL